MREYLAEDVYKSLIHSIENGGKVDSTIAEQVAAGMKNWAISKGATHYTHWFQPSREQQLKNTMPFSLSTVKESQ